MGNKALVLKVEVLLNIESTEIDKLWTEYWSIYTFYTDLQLSRPACT